MGCAPLSKIFHVGLFEIYAVDLTTKVIEAVHLYHRVRNRVQDVTDVKRSGNVGV